MGFSRNAVDSWATRTAPQTQEMFNSLLNSVKNIMKEDSKENFGTIFKKEEFSQRLFEILNLYGFEDSKNIVNEMLKESLVETIETLLRFAYNKKNHRRKTVLPQPLPQNNYSRLVIFDLDGTLIKGIKYSWTLLYQAVGLQTEVCKYNKKRFENREITYPEWCQYDFEELKMAGLTKEKAYSATQQNCSLTKNFSSAIHMLKNSGFAVAIISGGADPVLYSLIPNANELFEGNILINQLIFNQDGTLKEIKPTEYDWDDGFLGVKGKKAGLELFCKKYNIKYDEETKTYPDCVFVGDDDNDFKAMEAAGMCIFYHSSAPGDKTFGMGETVGEVRSFPKNIKFISVNDLLYVVGKIKEHYKISP